MGLRLKLRFNRPSAGIRFAKTKKRSKSSVKCSLILTAWCTMHPQVQRRFRKFLARNNTIMMPQPPYAPDMALCDIFRCLKIKRTLRGPRFTSIGEIKYALLKELKAISKIEFQKCLDDWKKYWHKCILPNGGYFGG